MMKAYSLFLAMLAASATPAVGAESTAPLGAAPNLDDDVKNVVFAELWERPELTRRDRSLVTITAEIAQGHLESLPFQFALALENGVEPQELSGAVTHIAYYSGVSAAVEAEAVLARVFAQRGIKTADLKVVEAKPAPDAEAAKAQREVVLSMVGDVSPGLAHFSNTILNGDLWLREDLSPRDRSLVTVSALITQGNVEQIPVHVNKGIGNGLTRAEIGEVITQLAFYAGWPRAFSAAAVVKEMDLPE
ncbi:carboxymuconolactone decarboxylase family protein [Mangrovimicrobium sediminis]|uniref:Carboxymuconolactone decarboxylase family protein n=1 Tax=Mangrovimicrobium sediminis TaxID=2562682 RepID=A0A4Z0LY74_9GAMM|nr:carboxymuconolactone decarboxylase family protein [Haliea sp. SAOS-164]TGD72239.1 carboxymuconolactone decarboxylase family protein [Haliea sp. SAOS-164]